MPEMLFIVRPDTVKSEMSSPEIGSLKVSVRNCIGMFVRDGNAEMFAVGFDVSIVT